MLSPYLILSSVSLSSSRPEVMVLQTMSLSPSVLMHWMPAFPSSLAFYPAAGRTSAPWNAHRMSRRFDSCLAAADWPTSATEWIKGYLCVVGSCEGVISIDMQSQYALDFLDGLRVALLCKLKPVAPSSEVLLLEIVHK